MQTPAADTFRCRSRRRVGAGVLAAVVVAATLAGTAGPVAAYDSDEPLFVDWSSWLPATATGYDPGSEDDCLAGRIQCVDKVIRTMTRRYQRLASVCDHDAVFALTYLRTTEEYRRTVEDPTFFTDTPFVNHQDVVFARYYFEPYDRWHSGDTGAVPPAWRVAFDAADRRAVSGSGNLLLGMSAHVNRDLPFVLAGIGLVAPDGSSRKADHDKVNQFLNRVMEPLLAEAAARFDPTIDDAMVDGTTLDATVLLQMLVAWRERAWRNAESLAAAATPAEREAVARRIEDQAEMEAWFLRASTAYRQADFDAAIAAAVEVNARAGLLGLVELTARIQLATEAFLSGSASASDSSARDAWCAEHWDDPWPA